MRWLVTGATGLLGRCFVVANLGENEITALVREIPRDPLAGVTYVEWNLTDGMEDDLPRDQFDAIIHLAQSRNYRDFPESAQEVLRTNLVSTAVLLDFARKRMIPRFVLASTGGLYSPSGGPLIETDLLASPMDLDFYFSTKLGAEALVGAYRNILEVSIMRIFFMYGVGQDPRQLIPRLIDSVKEGRPIHLGGEDGLLLNPIHVTDAASGLIEILRSQTSGIVNVAGSEIVSLRRLCGLIGEMVGREPVFYPVSPGRNLVADNSALKALGWFPGVSLHEGLRQMIQ